MGRWSAWSYSEAISLSQCETLGRRWLWEEDCCANVRRPPHISSHSQEQQVKRFFGSATKMSLKSHSKVHSCLTLTFSHHPECGGGALGPCLNTKWSRRIFHPQTMVLQSLCRSPIIKMITIHPIWVFLSGYWLWGRGWRWCFWRP